MVDFLSLGSLCCSLTGSQNTGCCKQPLVEGGVTDLLAVFKSTSHKFSIEAVFKASEASFNGRRPSERQGREVRKKSL